MNWYQKAKRKMLAETLNVEPEQPKPRRRFVHRLPQVKLDMTEARRWYIPRSERVTK